MLSLQMRIETQELSFLIKLRPRNFHLIKVVLLVLSEVKVDVYVRYNFSV